MKVNCGDFGLYFYLTTFATSLLTISFELQDEILIHINVMGATIQLYDILDPDCIWGKFVKRIRSQKRQIIPRHTLASYKTETAIKSEIRILKLVVNKILIGRLGQIARAMNCYTIRNL